MKKIKLNIFLVFLLAIPLFASISPTGVTKSTNLKTFTYTLTNTINSTNGGINYIVLTLPEQFDLATPSIANVVVKDYYDDSVLRTLTTVSLSTSWNFTANEAALTVNGKTLTIVLGSLISNMSVASHENIAIDLNMYTTNAFTNAEFTAKVGSRVFRKMSTSQKSKVATTGLQTVTGSAVVSRIPDPAFGYSSITPNAIIQGSDSYSFTYYIMSDNSYIEDIKQAAILIPSTVTIDTQTIDSFLLNNDSAHIKITNMSSLTGPGTNVMLIDYAGEGQMIAAGGAMDILTFSIKGNVSKGNILWKCWVDGTAVDGNSLLTTTNSSLPRQDVDISGAPPKVAGGIVKPVNSDPVVLFNTITANTLEYKIENRAPGSEVDNKIQMAVITVPAIFTNLTSIPITSRKISSSYIKIGHNMDNTTSITLLYAQAGVAINPNYDYDTIKMLSYHNLTTNQTTNVSFSCVVNNSNGLGFYPLTYPLINDLLVTDPIPLGSVQISVDDGYIYTTDLTNSITYKLYNTAPSGIIKYSTIHLPNTIATALNITSSKGATISVNWPDIELDYSSVGYLVVNSYDTIQFDLVDNYTNTAVPLVTTITGTVANATKTNYTSDKDVALGLTRKISFVPQEARVKGYTVNKNFLSSVSTFTLFYAISNYGEPGNLIDKVAIYFTNAAVTIGVGNVTNLNFPSAVVSYAAGPVITLDYSAANFDSGDKDIIQIVGDYSIVGTENDYSILSRVTVNTSTLVPVEVKSGENMDIHFIIPPPDAKAYVTPNIVFTTTGSELNYLTYCISNSAQGQNPIVRAVIDIPDLFTNISIVSSTHIVNEGVGITNTATGLILNYEADSSNFLAVGEKDYITLAVTNRVSDITNTTITATVYNAHKSATVGTKSGHSSLIDIIEQSLISISPHQKYITDVTNSYTFMIRNGTALDGNNIIRARLTINTQYYDYNSIQLASDHNLFVTAKKTNMATAYYYYIDYSGNPLTPGSDDTFTFKINDKITSTNTLFWTAEVDYNDGYGFRSTKPESTDSDKVTFVVPDVSALSWITPNSIPDLNVESIFAYTVSNTGVLGNDITMVRIKVPSSTFTNIVFLSNTINSTNFLVGTGVVSNFVINYAAKGSFIGAGQKDVIYFKAYDNWPSGSGGPFVWQCDAANTIDSNFTNPTTANNVAVPVSNPSGQKVFIAVADYGAEAKIYPAESSAIDTTTSTNKLIYYIKNVSKQANNDITEIKISIPTNYFSTNNLLSNVVSSNGGTFSLNGNVLTVSYSVPLVQDAKEYIVLNSLVDTFSHGSVNNVPWNMQMLFSTAGSNYISPAVAEGGTLSVDFVMPEPSAQAFINPKQIYTTSSTNVVTIVVTNKGTGSNDLDKVEITIPQIFTNYITSDNITNRITGSLATNITYDSLTQKVTLLYDTNFNVNTVDRFNLQIIDDVNTEESRDWVFSIYNIEKHIDIITPDSPVVGVRTPPFAALVCTSTIDPQGRIESTSITNDFEMLLDNKGSCTNPILKAYIKAPAPFIGLVTSSTTAKGGTIINNITSMTIDYTGIGGLKKGVADKIDFKAADNYIIGDTNFIYWTILVSDGQGYADTQVPENGQQYVDFYTPDPSAEGNITPRGIYNDRTNVHFTYTIKNTGNGDNDIRKIIIDIPGVSSIFFGLHNVSSSVGTVITSSTQIIITLADNDVRPNDILTVNFSLTNNLHDSETNVTFSSYCANVTNGPLYPIKVPAGKKYQDLSIKTPSGTSLGYIEKPAGGRLFTLDTNTSVQFVIQNNFSLSVDKALIYIANQNFKILNATSEYGADIRIGNQSIITLNYTNALDSNPLNNSDSISIDLAFSNNVTKCTVISLLYGGGASNFTQPGRGNDVLSVDVADFGRITGKVWPYNAEVSVKLLDQNGNSVKIPTEYTNLTHPVKNVKNDTDGSSGIYFLDFIPPGTYDIEFTGPGDTYWKKVYVNDFTVTTNKNYSFTEFSNLSVRLRNNPLRANSPDEQAISMHGTITDASMSLSVPAGSLLSDVGLDITSGGLNSPQKSDVAVNGMIQNISVAECDDLLSFNFDLVNSSEEEQSAGVDLKDECELNFKYYSAYESVLTSKGWNEDDLALYYWDDAVQRWYKVGGTVDTVNNTVTAKVNHLHTKYAVFASKKSTDPIYDVVVDNNPFMPLSDNPEYQHTIVNFSLGESSDTAKVKIFNMLGEKVYEKDLDTSSGQGMLDWDGKNLNGEVVKSGAYLFQIRVGKNLYTGSILVIK